MPEPVPQSVGLIRIEPRHIDAIGGEDAVAEILKLLLE
jgi:hypothetical protein